MGIASSLSEIIPYVVIIGVALGAFVGGIILGIKKNNNVPTVTKYDLLQMKNQIEETSRKDRHDIYNKIERHYAGIGLEIHRMEDNIAEYVKNVEDKFVYVNDRMTKIEIDQAKQQRIEIYKRGDKT